MVGALFNRIPPWGGAPPPSLWPLGVMLRWLSVRTCSGPGPGRSGRAWPGWRVSGPEQEHCPSRWRPLPGERAGQRVEARNGARTPPKRGWRVSGPAQEHCPSRWRPLPGERAGQRVEARNGARTPPKRGWRVSGPAQEHCPSRWRPLPGERAGSAGRGSKWRPHATENLPKWSPKSSESTENGAKSHPKAPKMEPKGIRNRRKWIAGAKHRISAKSCFFRKIRTC